jgi:DNA-directed RNA polymerase specialized sigma24 family protein
MSDQALGELERLLGELRPKFHRYSARMTGSAVDGEDIVQDAMIKAFVALPHVGVVENPEVLDTMAATDSFDDDGRFTHSIDRRDLL